MTLHEAMKQLLLQQGQPMTPRQIALALNKNGWYQKKDGSTIQAYQILGRTRKYAELFECDGKFVSLIGDSASKASLTAKGKSIKRIAKPTTMDTKSSFEPISTADTTILILGTMPGDKSLELGEYYGHSSNRFWKIIATITNNELPLTYVAKKELLRKSNIGVWDVVHQANRKGSLDIAIKDEEPNDLDSFIAKHKNLKVIGFNGAKSQVLFDTYFDRKSDVNYIALPSTSPANAGMNFESICNHWRQLLTIIVVQ